MATQSSNSERACHQNFARLDEFVFLHARDGRYRGDLVGPGPASRSEQLVETVRVRSRISVCNDRAPASILGCVCNAPLDLVRVKRLRQLCEQSVQIHVRLGFFDRHRRSSSREMAPRKAPWFTAENKERFKTGYH